MGLDFFRFLRTKNGKGQLDRVEAAALVEAAQEYQIRELCFHVCVNMMANAISRCEVRTFVGGKETRGAEYYLWNVEPNTNQSSTAFWHKAIYRLCCDNEVLIVPVRRKKGREGVAVADSWTAGPDWPVREHEYAAVTVGDVTFDKPFKESEVLHLKLHHRDMVPVVNALYQSYYKLYSAAFGAATWGKGQHWKVHVDRMAQGDDNWQAQFQTYIQNQVKPFLTTDGAILTEFDGYKFENAAQKDGRTNEDTRDIRALINDIMDFTAQGFQIPPVLIKGTIEAVGDAKQRWMSLCIDPICDQLQEEITRKRYGFDSWSRGDYVRVDSSSIEHFDLFANANSVEKLVGGGAFTINDILRAANMEPIAERWADAHLLTKNIGTMESGGPGGTEKGGSAGT